MRIFRRADYLLVGIHRYPLRSCDFFLWPYLKNSIFQQPVDNLDELQHIIMEKINETSNFNHILNSYEMSQMELGEEFERAWMKAVAILITYCKLFIQLMKVHLMKIYCL
jgi:hypothetical protein